MPEATQIAGIDRWDCPAKDMTSRARRKKPSTLNMLQQFLDDMGNLDAIPVLLSVAAVTASVNDFLSRWNNYKSQARARTRFDDKKCCSNRPLSSAGRAYDF